MMYELRETLLKVEGINKSFDKPVLRDISFEIKNIYRPGIVTGQIVSLVGRSGGGKTTLFNVLSGLLEPDSGKVEIVKDRGYYPVREGDMGVVFQNSYIWEWRTVEAILKEAATRCPVGSMDKLCEDLDIQKLYKKYSSQLSGGQRQRVAIAEQILNGGNFILLDEPFSGLDTLTIDKVTKILVDIAGTDEYKTIIIVSHDLSNCLAISDMAFVLATEDGKLGSTITHQVDLAQMGLAWTADIKDNPSFRELLKEVKSFL